MSEQFKFYLDVVCPNCEDELNFEGEVKNEKFILRVNVIDASKSFSLAELLDISGHCENCGDGEHDFHSIRIWDDTNTTPVDREENE